MYFFVIFFFLYSIRCCCLSSRIVCVPVKFILKIHRLRLWNHKFSCNSNILVHGSIGNITLRINSALFLLRIQFQLDYAYVWLRAIISLAFALVWAITINERWSKNINNILKLERKKNEIFQNIVPEPESIIRP